MMKSVMIACLILALIAVVAYVLMGIGVIQPGDLQTDDTMPAFYYIIPVGYLIIGVLVLLKKRWLWITLAAFNAFTIVVFYAMYAGQPDVMFSAPGLITKIAQILLEIGLIYLIITFKRKETD
ncbi:MAG TPA: hypothetical protein VMW86_10275 [Dehalococcoidales bacterium]|nr:hypothetical protein [Dehalococcoidales bacterium]